MMEDLTKLPNIGKVLAAKLNAIGVTSYQDLADLGSVETVLKLDETEKDACYNMLYALEGAVQGIRWHALSKETRVQLKAEFDAARVP
jgi:DNA transformation protein